LTLAIDDLVSLRRGELERRVFGDEPVVVGVVDVEGGLLAAV
jgi:hypothetical protein